MHTSSEPKLIFHHITLFIWISWVAVFLSAILMATFWFGFLPGIVIGGISMLFSLVYLAKNYIEHWTEYIVLEESCITLHTGIFWKTKSQIPYYKVNNISITDFLWIHNLTLDTGNDTTNIHFDAVQRPSELKEIINQRIEQERHFDAGYGKDTPQDEPESRSQTKSQYDNLEKQSMVRLQQPVVFQRPQPQSNFVPQQQQSQPNHVIDELERLNRLKIQGVLSPVEFEFAKKRVLMGK
jgi:membrane protein YdbS with pleckstrin-like domain